MLESSWRWSCCPRSRWIGLFLSQLFYTIAKHTHTHHTHTHRKKTRPKKINKKKDPQNRPARSPPPSISMTLPFEESANRSIYKYISTAKYMCACMCIRVRVRMRMRMRVRVRVRVRVHVRVRVLWYHADCILLNTSSSIQAHDSIWRRSARRAGHAWNSSGSWSCVCALSPHNLQPF